MKANIVFAAMTVAAILVPVADAFAIASLNTSRSNIYRQGITVIDSNDAAAVQACKEQGGKVETQGGKTVCNVPK
jgi:hypothetical protein